MKNLAQTFAIIIALSCAAQSQELQLYETRGARQLTIDAAGNPKRFSSRYGNSIWNNFAATGWFSSMTANYIWLDWGKLVDQGNGLPDEVVDGFRFAYGIYNLSTAGISFNMYYYDSCTGWGDYSTVLEAGFFFSGLPNAGNLPPGYWMWEITVDLEGSGSEFLLGHKIGIGQQLSTPSSSPVVAGPCLAYPPGKHGNGETWTEDSFEIWSPDGQCVWTYWFGGYPANPYGSFRNELLGGQDPAINMAYAGIGWQGNDAALYAIGSWTAGEEVRFLLRKNEMNQESWILANTTFYWPPLHLPWYDITLGPRMPFLAVLAMPPDPTGDFASLAFSVGPNAASMKIYMQGAITDVFNGGPLEPLELSNSLIAN